MEIKKAAIEKFMGPLAEEEVNVKVSLFVVSPKNQRLKKLNLENLTHEERAAKLHKWGKEKRFVAVIEMGDMVFAHAHAKHAERLQLEGGLSLDGKKVIIKALTDDESDQLALIGEAFEEHVLQQTEEEVKDSDRFPSAAQRQYFAGNRLVSDQMQMHHLIDCMIRNNLDKIIIRSMRLFNEARRELQKQKEADDKYFDILRSEIKKEVLKSEIKADEIKRQEQKHRILGEDEKHIHRTRGHKVR